MRKGRTNHAASVRARLLDRFHCRPAQRFDGMARQVVDHFMASLAS